MELLQRMGLMDDEEPARIGNAPILNHDEETDLLTHRLRDSLLDLPADPTDEILAETYRQMEEDQQRQKETD